MADVKDMALECLTPIKESCRVHMSKTYAVFEVHMSKTRMLNIYQYNTHLLCVSCFMAILDVYLSFV